jgi:hypothetical protein
MSRSSVALVLLVLICASPALAKPKGGGSTSSGDRNCSIGVVKCTDECDAKANHPSLPGMFDLSTCYAVCKAAYCPPANAAARSTGTGHSSSGTSGSGGVRTTASPVIKQPSKPVNSAGSYSSSSSSTNKVDGGKHRN